MSFVNDLHRDAANSPLLELPPPDDCGAAGSRPALPHRHPPREEATDKRISSSARRDGERRPTASQKGHLLTGDRTTLFIESLKSDREAVVKLFDDPEEEHPSTSGPAAEFLVFSQVNYGGRDDLACLASEGIAFSARHEDGDDYHGMTFAACDGIFAEIASPRGQLMVGVHPKTLEPDALDLENLRLWRETEDRVRAVFAAAANPSSA